MPSRLPLKMAGSDAVEDIPASGEIYVVSGGISFIVFDTLPGSPERPPAGVTYTSDGSLWTSGGVPVPSFTRTLAAVPTYAPYAGTGTTYLDGAYTPVVTKTAHSISVKVKILADAVYDETHLNFLLYIYASPVLENVLRVDLSGPLDTYSYIALTGPFQAGDELTIVLDGAAGDDILPPAADTPYYVRIGQMGASSDTDPICVTTEAA